MSASPNAGEAGIAIAERWASAALVRLIDVGGYVYTARNQPSRHVSQRTVWLFSEKYLLRLVAMGFGPVAKMIDLARLKHITVNTLTPTPQPQLQRLPERIDSLAISHSARASVMKSGRVIQMAARTSTSPTAKPTKSKTV
jgi:hypothetical protein